MAKMQMLVAALALAAVVAATEFDADLGAALEGDEQCAMDGEEGTECSLNALQLKTNAEEGSEWFTQGGKVWGAGLGMESISRHNVGYYDKGMYAARKYCGGHGCALITNPKCCRSMHVFHVHYVHYHGYGVHLHKKLESKVCGRHGWHGGGLPCHGKAAYFPGFPGVFSVAMHGGDIGGASVVAWPASCGGHGTIVQLAYHCSIEHQIRGDYQPGHR